MSGGPTAAQLRVMNGAACLPAARMVLSHHLGSSPRLPGLTDLSACPQSDMAACHGGGASSCSVQCACLPAAPEVLSNGRTYDGTKCDVWSSAVMLYVMLFCEYPFERPEDEQHPHKFQKMLERTKRLDYRLGSPDSQQLSGVAYCSSLHRNTMPYQEPFANCGISAHLNLASASGKSKGAVRLLCGCLPELPVPCNLGKSSHWCPHAAEGCTVLQSRRLPCPSCMQTLRLAAMCCSAC